ncbi:hypothetical protein BTA51_19585 [Hahella sp. CCB-MM4]|uniref:hypothetical protein n=1 Tax=Hahella sp. (strain CCB-MM4) TaxID=1926491 RepID=UPI000B9A1FF3|nr:hypothetical protein [Hahella sp. CCB-MM4]OZG71825.1 hypothetical protein BTA51_19585 [Hahella sp. CCB-MM4]
MKSYIFALVGATIFGLLFGGLMLGIESTVGFPVTTGEDQMAGRFVVLVVGYTLFVASGSFIGARLGGR